MQPLINFQRSKPSYTNKITVKLIVRIVQSSQLDNTPVNIKKYIGVYCRLRRLVVQQLANGQRLPIPVSNCKQDIITEISECNALAMTTAGVLLC